jgi:hypothetical protein
VGAGTALRTACGNLSSNNALEEGKNGQVAGIYASNTLGRRLNGDTRDD